MDFWCISISFWTSNNNKLRSPVGMNGGFLKVLVHSLWPLGLGPSVKIGCTKAIPYYLIIYLYVYIYIYANPWQWRDVLCEKMDLPLRSYLIWSKHDKFSQVGHPPVMEKSASHRRRSFFLVRREQENSSWQSQIPTSTPWSMLPQNSPSDLEKGHWFKPDEKTAELWRKGVNPNAINFPFGDGQQITLESMVILWMVDVGLLVGGIPTPLKNMISSVGMIIPNIWKNKKCSKPPASLVLVNTTLVTFSSLNKPNS